MSLNKLLHERSPRSRPIANAGRQAIAMIWLFGLTAAGAQCTTQAYGGSSLDKLQHGMPRVYLVDLGGARKGDVVGCGDRLVAVGAQIPRTLKEVRASLERLTMLPVEPNGPGSYYNALGRSRLRVAGLRLHGGVLHLSLNGQLVMGGMCDGPRIEAQLERTIAQGVATKHVCIDLNGQPLYSVLSLR